MEPFDDDGVFWLPNTPERPVSGHLRFDGEAFTLETGARLVHAEMRDDEDVSHGMERIVHPAILGRMRKLGEVTLLDADGVPSPPFYGDGREEWSARIALLSSHIVRPMFSRASFSFDVLVPWAKPPSIVNWDTPAIGTIDITRRELARATVKGVTLRLVADWTGEAGGDAVDVRRRCWLGVDLPSLGLDDLLEQWVRPMQDMLIVLLGRPVRLTDLSVVPVERPEEFEDASGGRSESSARVVFGGLLAAPAGEASWASLRTWGAPTMFVREELPVAFEDLIAGWFATRDSFGEAITLMCSPFYAPFMYSEHRYSATFQSAEAIARVLHGGPDRAKQEHQGRVAAIVGAARAAGVSDQDVAWAQGVLQSRNDKPLRQLLSELLAGLGILGEKVLERDPNFARTAASARARVAHPGGQDLTTEQRYWYGQVLLWVVRARLAIEAGIPLPALAERVLERGYFTHTVEKIQPPD